MRDRFALAFVLSITLHLLVMEVVGALDLLWPAASSGPDRQVIPVALLEVDPPVDLSAQPQENKGRAVHQKEDTPASSPANRGRAVVHARNAAATPSRVLDKVSARPAGQVRQPPEETPAVAVTAAPDDGRLTQNPLPIQDADRCAPAVSPEGAAEEISGAGAGLAGGSEVEAGGKGRGNGNGNGNGGGSSILIPGELLANNSPPRYPLLARRNGWEGTVVIAILVSDMGWVQEARIEKSSGFTVLDQAALRAVRNWRIEPAGRIGDSGNSFRVPVVFTLTSS